MGQSFWGQDVLDRADGTADDTRDRPEHAVREGEIPGGQRHCSVVNTAANPGKQVVAGHIDRTAQHDACRVDDVDHGGDEPAEHSRRFPEQPDRLRIALPDVFDQRVKFFIGEVSRAEWRSPVSGSCSARIIADAEATASRHPTLPQRQTTWSLSGTRMWPMSPAAPSAPSCSSPEAPMIPHPIPVDTLMKTKGYWLGGRARASPNAIKLASLLTRTWQPKQSRRTCPTGKASHPGINGGLTGVPVERSTGPGRPTAMVRTRSGTHPAADSISRHRSSINASVPSGPLDS